MKKVFCPGIFCLVLLAVMACTSVTTVPLMLTTDERPEIEILGEILYESRERVGLIELLKAARKLYPDCDYVIDIMVDQKTTTTSYFPLVFLRSKQDITWVMRGTAIKYKR